MRFTSSRSDTEAAERELRWGYEALEQVGEKVAHSTLSADLAEALYRLGRYEEAEDLARESLEATSPEDIASQVTGRTVMGKILAVKSVYDQVEQTAREGVALGDPGRATSLLLSTMLPSGGVVRPVVDFSVMLALRIAFTAAAMAFCVWLLVTGKPLGGLLIVPLLAIWIRRRAESGRLTRFSRRSAMPS